MKNTDLLSFWTEESLPAFKTLNESLRTEVCVVGAGITGILAAYQLCQEGKKVVVLDAVGLAGGETAYTTGHLTWILDYRYHELMDKHGMNETKRIFESHRDAIDVLEIIVKKEKIDCDFMRVPGELHFHSESELEKEADALVRLGIPFRQEGNVLIFSNQAQFHPIKFLKGLHSVLEKKKVRFYKTRVTDVVEGRRVRVKFSKGKVLAGACVLATHTPSINRFFVHSKQEPFLSYVLGARIPKGSFTPKLWWDTLEPYHYVRMVALKDHDLLIVGGEDHRNGQEKNPELCFKHLQTWALNHFPQINKMDYRWSGEIFEPIDGLAFIGKNWRQKHVYIATGYSGNGLTYGVIAGRLVSDLIVHGDSLWADLYKPSRKNWKTVLKFIKNGIQLAGEYCKLLPGFGVVNKDKLQKGDGVVVQEGIHKVAIYRDTDGVDHRYSAICTHLGCVVQWNKSSKSWDCPCHGSRFTAKGKVMSGPAMKNLKQL